MDIAITGSQRLIGDGARAPRSPPTATGSSRSCASARAPTSIHWDPDDRPASTPPTLEGVDAVVHLAGRGHRREALDRCAEGPHPRQPQSTAPRCWPARLAVARPPAERAAERLGHRLLRRPRGRRSSPRSRGRRRLPGRRASTAWEARRRARTAAGIRVAHLRTGIVLAADGGVLGQAAAARSSSGSAVKLGGGHQYMSWISLDDEVAAIRGCSTTTSPARSTSPPPSRSPTRPSPRRSARSARTDRPSSPSRGSGRRCCSAASSSTSCCWPASGCSPAASPTTASRSPTRRSKPRCVICSTNRAREPTAAPASRRSTSTARSRPATPWCRSSRASTGAGDCSPPHLQSDRRGDSSTICTAVTRPRPSCSAG